MICDRKPASTTAYTLALEWLESEGYQLIDQGIYSKQPELEGPLEIQVTGCRKFESAYVRAMNSSSNWLDDLPEIQCEAVEQFVAVVRNFEYLAKKLRSAAA